MFQISENVQGQQDILPVTRFQYFDNQWWSMVVKFSTKNQYLLPIKLYY